MVALNEKAIAFKRGKNEEPDKARRCLCQALEIIKEYKNSCGGGGGGSESQAFHEVVISYNIAACYWELRMLEDCADHLENAVDQLTRLVQRLQ